VTVVVPSFRQGRFLDSALRSITSQTTNSVESLVFDNCSDDETPSVLKRFAGRVTNITVAKDRGQSAALNQGFAAARGDILVWLNADDMLMPSAVEQAVAAMDQTGADVVYGRCAHLDAAGQFTSYFPFTRSYEEDELRNWNNFLPQPATFFRRALLERAGTLDESLHYAMDWDLWCRFAKCGARFHYAPEVWAGARVHPQAKTSRGGVGRVLEIGRINRRHRTTKLPLVPFLYLAHRANRVLNLAGAPSVLGWWRGLTKGDRSTVVDGVASPSMIVDDPARLHYPVFAEVSGLTVDLDDAAYPPATVLANGRELIRRGGTYEATLTGETLNVLDIRVSAIRRPLPAPLLVCHFPRFRV
jgi:glycosyltransferase involved in cell wall biosynthesis